MALVANANGFGLLQPGMAGPQVTRLDESMKLFDLRRARELGGVVDYVIGANPGGSVFLIGYSDDPTDKFYMDYYKMGDGPFYFFMRPYHLCHFETPFAIREAVDHKAILTQKRRVLEVGCRAKSDLSPGVKLEGIGGRHVYGVLEEAGGLPVVLAGGTVLKRPKRKDESITWEDISYPKDDSRIVVWEEQHKLDS